MSESVDVPTHRLSPACDCGHFHTRTRDGAWRKGRKWPFLAFNTQQETAHSNPTPTHGSPPPQKVWGSLGLICRTEWAFGLTCSFSADGKSPQGCCCGWWAPINDTTTSSLVRKAKLLNRYTVTRWLHDRGKLHTSYFPQSNYFTAWF